MANCVQCGRQLPGLSFGRSFVQWCVQHEAAQRGEDIPFQRVEPAPWVQSQSSSMIVTQGILGINVAVFVAMAVGWRGDARTIRPVRTWCIGEPNFGPLTVSGQWWPAADLHFSFMADCCTSGSTCGACGASAESRNRLRPLDFCHGMYLISRVVASPRELNLESSDFERGRFGGDFWDCGGADRFVLSGEFSMPRAALSGTCAASWCLSAITFFLGNDRSDDNAAHIGGLLMVCCWAHSLRRSPGT